MYSLVRLNTVLILFWLFSLLVEGCPVDLRVCIIEYGCDWFAKSFLFEVGSSMKSSSCRRKKSN